MGAAAHVGRVGGLAVALGVGTAILTGQGVACAAPVSDTASTSTGTDDSTTSSATPKKKVTTELKAVETAKHGVEQAIAKLPNVLRRALVVAADGAAPKAKAARPTATFGARRLQIPTTAVAATATTGTSKSPKPKNAPEVAPRSTIAHTLFGRQPAAEAPKAAGLAAERVDGPADTAKTAVSNVVVRVVQDVLDPGAGTNPASPTQTPVAWVLAAASRREIGTTTISYDPELTVVDGVITGKNPTGNAGLTYTVVAAPSGGGKVTVDKTTGGFTYLPYSSGLTGTSQTFGDPETFKVLVAENTQFDKLLEALPVVGGLVEPILVQVHQVPILGDVLSPLIGRADVIPVTVDDAQFATGAPIAFTTTVTSFDGTPISVNWFPALGLTKGGTAPTILNGPSLATAGYIEPSQETTVFGLVPGLAQLRAGYNVVTWDPRGEFASGGVLQLDSPDYEAKDVSAIITWVAGQPDTKFDPNTPVVPGEVSTPDGKLNNPLIGMVGGSYGGGIQLTSAGIDQRIDAIAPGIAWNNLYDTLYPNHGFKTSFASLLLLSLVVSGSRINPNIYTGIATGALLGILLPGQKDFLEGASPSNVVEDIDIPTLLLQGTVDVLFPLQQAVTNAENIPGGPVKMVWYCGGHGQCLDPVDADEQTAFLAKETLAWMDTYVMYKGTTPPASDAIPNFQWVDQKGDLYWSDFLPTAKSALYEDSKPIIVSSVGGILPIVPVLGGSGPSSKATFPVSLATASKAIVAVDVPVPNPASSDPEASTYVVGAPTVTLHYSGIGTSRNVYAQLVDKQTGRVVGNILTPIPVTLDGQSREITVPMEDVAYTMDSGATLELQIVGTATPFEDFTSYGVIDISQVDLTLPTANPKAVHYEDSFTSDQPPVGSGTLLGI